jgi:hypothetical protein
VIDAVEERRQIDVHHHTVSCSNVVAHLLDRLMRVTSGAKPVTVVAELALEIGRELLRDRLLDNAVGHVGNTQWPFVAIRFGNPHASYRLRLIVTIQQLLLDGRPVLTRPCRKVRHGDRVHAGRALVRLHAPPGALQVLSGDDSLQWSFQGVHGGHTPVLTSRVTQAA